MFFVVVLCIKNNIYYSYFLRSNLRCSKPLFTKYLYTSLLFLCIEYEGSLYGANILAPLANRNSTMGILPFIIAHSNAKSFLACISAPFAKRSSTMLIWLFLTAHLSAELLSAVGSAPLAKRSCTVLNLPYSAAYLNAASI